MFGLWQDGAKRYLWAVAMGLTGMILTKETYIIHFGCFLCAVPVLFLLEEISMPSRRPLPRPSRRPRRSAGPPTNCSGPIRPRRRRCSRVSPPPSPRNAGATWT